jgi:hypothetical protein
MIHAHRCDCGLIWHHGDENHGKEGPHTCPVCGGLQYKRYLGQEWAKLVQSILEERISERTGLPGKVV